MARRRELKSIASGIAAHCVSRNNDISGYWALGIISKLANQTGVDFVSVDILSDDKLSPELAEFRRNFRDKFESSRHNLYRFISDFVVDFKFDPYSVSDWRGQMSRTTCTVHIIDDLKKRRSASAVSFCYPHNPQFELKSTRARVQE